ncbi:hypothetical protein SEVIR_2G381350v4 [Setaria viridis]
MHVQPKCNRAVSGPIDDDSFHPPTKNMLCNRHMLTVAGPFHSLEEKRSKKLGSWAPLPPPHATESIHPSISWRRQPHMGQIRFSPLPTRQRTRLMPKLSFRSAPGCSVAAAHAHAHVPSRQSGPRARARARRGRHPPIRGLANPPGRSR